MRSFGALAKLGFVELARSQRERRPHALPRLDGSIYLMMMGLKL
jgi:hypothetical protein